MPMKYQFSTYQKIVLAILAFLQFTVISSFMIFTPLGTLLEKQLSIMPAEFANLVSVYAFCAAGSGILMAGFADRFDRKKMLLFFYPGFLMGTALCGFADGYEFLLSARILTGVFGGVVGSIVYAIMIDLFPMEVRGRVMGFVQMAIGASQALAIPAGIYIAYYWGWRFPFFIIAGLGLIVGVMLWYFVKPIDAHTRLAVEKNPLHHLLRTLFQRPHLQVFLAVTLLSLSSFIFVPFGREFFTHNLGIDAKFLPTVFIVNGIFSLFMSPLIGSASDYFGKNRVFFLATLVSVITVLIYTNLGTTSLVTALFINILMFVAVSSRIIPFQALISEIPSQSARGAFMSISFSIQQLSMSFVSVLAGYIVTTKADGSLENFEYLGYVAVGMFLVVLLLFYRIHRRTLEKTK